MVNKALQKAGIDISEVESVFLPAGTNTLSVLQAGQIDVAVAIDATLSAYEAQGARRLVNAGDVGVDNSLFFLASRNAIENKKEAIGAFVKQLGNHLAWANENQEKHAGFVAELLGLDPEVTLAVERNRPKTLQPIRPELIPSNQAIADELFRQKVIEKARPMSSNQSGNGRISTTRMVTTPMAMARSLRRDAAMSHFLAPSVPLLTAGVLVVTSAIEAPNRQLARLGERPLAVARQGNGESFLGILLQLVSERADGDAEDGCRMGAVAQAMAEGVDDQLALDVGHRAADQADGGGAAAGRRGRRALAGRPGGALAHRQPERLGLDLGAA